MRHEFTKFETVPIVRLHPRSGICADVLRVGHRTAAGSEFARRPGIVRCRSIVGRRQAGRELVGRVRSLSTLGQRGPLHTVFVCAGGNPAQWRLPTLTGALQRFSRNGVRIGGISGGPFFLAAAGLLQDRDFTIHWEHAPALIEAFPTLSPRHTRFVLDGNRVTCGGGVAPLDMMHALIAERMGADFARRVSDWFLHIAVSEHSAPQRASLAERYGVHHPVLLDILHKMETTIEQPLGRKSLAAFANVSERHLDRLFSEKLGVGFQKVYQGMRLEHARRLLNQSPLSLAEIAFATGFSSASHFSRCFRSRYGQAPGASRAKVPSR